MSETQRNRAQTVIGSVGFAVAFALILIGAFGFNNLVLLAGGGVAVADAVACVILEARRKVTHV